MASKELQIFYSVVLSLGTLASLFIKLLKPLDLNLENLENSISDGLTNRLKTFYSNYEEVKEGLLKVVSCIKVILLTQSKADLSFGCCCHLCTSNQTKHIEIADGNQQFLFPVQEFMGEIGMKTIDGTYLKLLIKYASDKQGLFGFKEQESASKEIAYKKLQYTAGPRNVISNIFHKDDGSITFESIPQRLIATDSLIESTNNQPRYLTRSNSNSTVSSIDKPNVIVQFQASENDIEFDAIDSVNTNDADNEIRFKSIVQCITDRIQELVRSFTSVSFTYDEIQDALMEANRSNGYVVRSGKNHSSDSVYRVRVTRLQMRVEITVEMFGRALRYCEGYDYVLTHTNIFPHNIRMFLHLPVLRGSRIHLSDCKHGNNF
ncbi:uncharacterized protein LOC128238584 isoform X4 [Mya arenaria]|uniref:uncharacterized protein LOC128238584 isoform X1 n=1 Tax=Mya arenaria TaxID=6604 RepID=UPI0022E3B0A5|nr:uncharacterized protein LOC128238584 isoform X1 [Mya arenaria]XP_052810610.1 uncharacterized protein LOC128238584 isoform X2 [Mya arenaria]XP_052810611.1 uncharacterized protein LOC128238584 isoform X3 [Mya arenaria]XP_052810612.1 uncharacterized protein LOC128238584 isoform X4 [Mya arenaria]